MSRSLFLSVMAGIGLGLLVMALLGAAYAYWRYSRVLVSTTPTVTTSSPQPSPTPDPLAPFGVLLLGFGGPNHDGGYLTDTILIAYVQPRLKQIALISLPRDLWVPLPITETAPKAFKLNAAYAIGRDDRRYTHKPAQFTGEGGGGAMAKQAVAQVTGLPIKYFAALSFDGFTKAIDTLGGITVKVPYAFDDPFYPLEDKKADNCGASEEELAAKTATLSGEKLEQSFACRYEQLHFDAGKQTLDGETALKYVRSRHSPQAGGDYNRSARQKAVLLAIKEQIYSVNFIPKIIPFISKLTWDMQTDVPLTQLQEWLSSADEYRQFSITTIEITDKNALKAGYSSDRQYILEPRSGEFNWQSVQEYIQAQLAESATSSGTLSTPSSDSTTPSGR